MNNSIFWENKGHTRKMALDNIWPTTSTQNTPKEFLEDKGIVLIIGPKKLESKYFMADFYCFDARSALYTEYPDYDGTKVIYCHFLREYFLASYTRKFLSIDGNAVRFDEKNKPRDYFMQFHIASQLLEQAVQLFDDTFPVQDYAPVININK